MDSKTQELDIAYRTRRNEILKLDDEIRNKEKLRSNLAGTIDEMRKTISGIMDETKTCQKGLEHVRLEAKKILDEARNVNSMAVAKENKADFLLKQRQSELDSLNKDRELIRVAREQKLKNDNREFELNKVDEDYQRRERELIVRSVTQKEMAALKESLEKEKESLNNIVDENKKIFKDIQSKSLLLDEDRKKLKEDLDGVLARVRKVEEKERIAKDKAVDLDASEKTLENKKIQFEKDTQEMLETIEVRKRLVRANENKISVVIDKIKKSKEFDDELKALGLI